jgi:hypothetical protein
MGTVCTGMRVDKSIGGRSLSSEGVSNMGMENNGLFGVTFTSVVGSFISPIIGFVR